MAERKPMDAEAQDEAPEVFTVIKTYTGYALYRGDVLIHTHRDDGASWPGLLQAIGHTVTYREVYESAYWERRNYQAPPRLRDLLNDYAAWERAARERQLAGYRSMAARLERELGLRKEGE